MSSLEGFRRGNDRDANRRASTEAAPKPPAAPQDDGGDDVDIDALIKSRQTRAVPAAAPQTEPHQPEEKQATPARTFRRALPQPAAGPKTVRSMNVPPELMVGLRVLAAVRNADHPELVMTAVAEHAESIPPAAETVKRRRRLQTAKLLVKLTDEQTELIDQLAEERLMTRSSFITAVLDEFVPVEMRGER